MYSQTVHRYFFILENLLFQYCPGFILPQHVDVNQWLVLPDIWFSNQPEKPVLSVEETRFE
jgi:hypothetical protein